MMHRPVQSPVWWDENGLVLLGIATFRAIRVFRGPLRLHCWLKIQSLNAEFAEGAEEAESEETGDCRKPNTFIPIDVLKEWFTSH